MANREIKQRQGELFGRGGFPVLQQLALTQLADQALDIAAPCLAAVLFLVNRIKVLKSAGGFTGVGESNWLLMEMNSRAADLMCEGDSVGRFLCCFFCARNNLRHN